MRRKAFSLVELVVVILIIAVLAVAVFAGGSAAIKKSQVARTTSDLHNFSIAAETTLTSTPSVANITNNSMGDGGMAKVVNEFNDLLAADYKLTSLAPLASADLGNIQIVADTADTGAYAIFRSAKTDAWDNPYYVIFDSTERHDGTSDFTITVVSAGSNAITKVGGEIEKDDVFMLAETSDSSVASVILKASDIGDVQCPLGARKVVGNSASSNAAATYAGVTGFTTASVMSLASGSSAPAVPAVVTYTIRFVNHNGTTLQSTDVEEGQLPSYVGDTPHYEDNAANDWMWVFNGWDKTINTATQDETYTATYYQNLCFIEGSKVLMADGSFKNIEDIAVGERVISYNVDSGEFYETEVIGAEKKYITVPYCEIALENGMTIYPTKNHPILTDEGFKTVVPVYSYGLLSIGDNVVTTDGLSKVVSIQEVALTEEMMTVYDINVKDDDEDVDADDDTNDNFVVEGVVTHNHSG